MATRVTKDNAEKFIEDLKQFNKKWHIKTLNICHLLKVFNTQKFIKNNLT